MTQDNVEQKRDIKWIVPLPQGEGGMFGRPSLCAACRGNEDIGVVLNYFVFEASREAKNKKIDLEKAEYIRLKRGLDEILDGIKPSRTSKTTLIGYHHKLHEWGLVLSDGYKQQYDVYFHKITEAIQNPPPEEKRKPRGRHVAKLQTSTDSNSEDFNFNNDSKLESSTVKTEIQEDSNFNQISVLTSQISKLEFEILNLKSEISALTSQMLNLKSSESSEVAPQQAGDTQNDALRLLRDCNRLLKTIKGNMVAVPRNMFSLLTEEDYQTIDELMTVASVASATPSPLIENLYQSQSLSETYPPEPPKGSARPTTIGQNDTPLTPAGNSTPTQEPTFPQSSALPENQEPHVLDNAIPEPPNRQKTGSEESQPVDVLTPSVEAQKTAIQTQEMPSSTQVVNGTSNQATEQPQQASGVDPIATPTIENSPAQQTLIEKPKQPQMPPASMKWCPEKLVQITEARRYCDNKQGAYFSEQLQGKSKKTQRQRQLEAAKRIIALDITEERYLKAYDDRNDDWWNETKGSLTVESMIANNKEGMPRILAILEKLDSRGSIKRSRNNVTPMRPANNPPTQQEPTPEKAASIAAAEAVMARLKQRQAI